MNLVEIENTLLSRERYGALKIQNEHYTFTITYGENYKEDRAKNKINPFAIQLRCICRDNSIMITKNRNGLYINPETSIFPDICNRNDLNDLIGDLTRAVETMEELEKIFIKYF